MQNTNLPIALHVFLINDQDEVLLLKRVNTGHLDGFWSVPAGRLQAGESATMGAIREAQEEVGVVIHKTDLSNPLIMHHKDERGERIYFFFIARQWEHEPKNMEPDSCGEIHWFPINQLPEDMVPHVRASLENILQGVTYDEFGF